MFNFNTTKRNAEPSLQTATGENRAAAYGGTGNAEQNLTVPNEAQINSDIEKIEAQRRELERKIPGFDMKAELENPAFVTYVFKNGISVEDAYSLIHRDEIIAAEVQAVMQRLSERRGRIAENGAGKNSPAAVKKNPKDMSDKEIDSIIERVQNGEKISF